MMIPAINFLTYKPKSCFLHNVEESAYVKRFRRNVYIKGI